MKAGLTHAERKAMPMARGLLDYFPAALAVVAACSEAANNQHNPGLPMQHARGKSADHADCAIRHLIDRGTLDSDGIRHTAKACWRLLALLQVELEADGWPVARAATFAKPGKRSVAARSEQKRQGTRKPGAKPRPR